MRVRCAAGACVRCERGKNLVDWRMGIVCPEGGHGVGDVFLEDFGEMFHSV